MSAPKKNGPSGKPDPACTSWECVHIVIDGPGDSTRRPLTGKALEFAKREREKIDRWQALYGHLPPEQRPPEVVDIVFDENDSVPNPPPSESTMQFLRGEREKYLQWIGRVQQQQQQQKDNGETKP
jgi:hypothetical protein